jgi:ligand-binding SRPBCC domain-containing protein
MSKIVLKTEIRASPEICYKLSLNVDLHKISASQTDEHIVGGVKYGIMKLGESVTWKARHLGIWQTLTTRITFAEPYRCFVDEMTQGAFKSMKHGHYFEPTENGTIMKDVFSFESPYGLAGKLFNFLVLEKYMKNFLAERNQRIKEVAESELHNNYI